MNNLWLKDQMSLCEDLLVKDPESLVQSIIEIESNSLLGLDSINIDLIIKAEAINLDPNTNQESKVAEILKMRTLFWKNTIKNPELFLKLIKPFILSFKNDRLKSKELILIQTKH